MQSRFTAISAFLMLAVVFSSTSKLAEAQQQTPSCAASLTPCAQYLNTTTRPGNECCDAIRQAVSTQLACLCNLYNTPGLLPSFGINTTQAVDLPRRCDLPSDSCTAASPGATNPGGGNNGNGGGNGVGTISWSALPSLLLLWAATYLF